MICKSCQKEINDNANFCPHCGYKFKSDGTNLNFSIKLNKTAVFWGIILFIFIALITFVFVEIPKTPEYALYKTCIAIKENNYEQSVKYVNIDKIVDNRVKALKKEMNSDAELQNNPFSGLAYIFVDAMTEKLREPIKEGFKKFVENNDNNFEEFSRPKLIYFLIVKSYDNVAIEKERKDDNETSFTFKDSDNEDLNNIEIILTRPNSKSSWEIVDISGYDFWKNYLNE